MSVLFYRNMDCASHFCHFPNSIVRNSQHAVGYSKLNLTIRLADCNMPLFASNYPPYTRPGILVVTNTARIKSNCQDTDWLAMRRRYWFYSNHTVRRYGLNAPIIERLIAVSHPISGRFRIFRSSIVNKHLPVV